MAGAYIGRIEAACPALETFPERGTRRDDIRPGLGPIVFRLTHAGVNIARICHGGQDTERTLRAGTED